MLRAMNLLTAFLLAGRLSLLSHGRDCSCVIVDAWSVIVVS